MVSKWIKNTDAGDKTWVGQLINPGAYYQVQAVEESQWGNDSQLLTDIGSGVAVVAKDDSGTTDIADVNTAINYLKDNVPKEVAVVTSYPFSDPYGFRARFKGITGTATKATTTNIDHVLTEDRWIDGVELIQSYATFGDYVDFQVVHPTDGVVDQFGETWYIDPSSGKQNPVVVQYPAKLLAGLTIRVAYTSVGTVDDVLIAANLRLHKKV